MSENFDWIVIGGGTAGLTAAGFGGQTARRVALIERERLGGDCTWAGCIPSKALLHIAKTAHHIRTAGEVGITVGAPVVDMRAVRDQIRRIVEAIAAKETPARFSAEYGVEVIIGEASFIDANTLRIGDRTLNAARILIAAGSRPAIPPIEGLDSVPYLTNRTIFDNDRLPEHLLIIGAGAIAVEIAQAYVRLGSHVTLIGDKLLEKEEPEARDLIRIVLEREGVTFHLTTIERAEQNGDRVRLILTGGGSVAGDLLLIAAGRAPNVEALQLERAGVEYTEAGIPTNNTLQTNVGHIYAIGDITTGAKFTHYAHYQGLAAGRNALLPIGKTSGIDDELPWVTFTNPEIARTGLSEAQARERFGDAVKVFTFSMMDGDRAVAERDTDGFLKLVYRGTGDLLGATIVAMRAGEMITELTMAVKGRLSLAEITETIHPYPTYSEIVYKAIAQLRLRELMNGVSGRIVRAATQLLP